MTKICTAAALAALALLSAMPPAAAAPAPKKGHSAKTAARTVYVCTECREYFSADAAKKMSYKDGMGHPLTKTAKAPAGFMDGSKSKM